MRRHSPDAAITVQCDSVSQRSLGAWAHSGQSERKSRYIQLVCGGYYVDGFVARDDPLRPATGIATLELYFTEAEMGKYAGSVTDLAQDGSHLEIALAFHVSMLDWTEKLLSKACAEQPMILFASRTDTGHLERTSLSLSKPRMIPNGGQDQSP